MTTTEGTLLWEPSEAFKNQSNLHAYMQWLAEQRDLQFADYNALWEWSTDNVEDFWESLWHYYRIQASQPYDEALSSHQMPGAKWFTGATLNYTEHVFRNATDAHPAVVFQSERHELTEVSWAELRQQVSAIAVAMREIGVERGDRVVAYIPNIPQALVAFLATASIGAIWSSCSPDFGSPSVIDRFTQIEPKVLFAVDGYQYGGKPHDRRSVVTELQNALPTLERTVLVPYLDADAEASAFPATVSWNDLLQTEGELTFEQVPFAHPLWVLYSSGTTGLPKPIVHSQGGILIEHMKSLDLHLDVKPGDRFFWFSTTGWMMWNLLVGTLLVGGTVVSYDGSPGWPDMSVLWKFAAASKISFFGTSAGFITASMKTDVKPSDYDLSALRGIGSTGSPLPPEGFDWVYEAIKRDLWLVSYSGGTDVCSGFVGGCPLLPVYSGEIQCRTLGAAIAAYDVDGKPVTGTMGELVLTEPMPSMPVFFWNDADNERYTASYFEMYPGVWRHGDWIVLTERDTVIIYGRSDSTINRQGIRMGTSELYRAVESIPEVLDSLVVDLEGLGGASYMPLFVVLREGVELDADLTKRIKATIRSALSPRHVPDEIFAIDDVPRTLSGKKLEVPVKKIMQGVPVAQAANPDSMKNPELLDYFAGLAEQVRSKG